MTAWDIVCADVNEWAKTYDGPPFHAVLCDAPYEMREIDIDNLGAQGKGFMNSDWDGSGVSFDPDTWRGIARHLLPGAFLFVFAGTINDDLISLAMRKAGLRKHHKAVLYHAQGQGFPKSTKICSQIDKAAGVEQELIINERWARRYPDGPGGGNSTFGQINNAERFAQPLKTAVPATPLAKTWAGHRYGLQAIKPAVESILIFQKPYAGKSVDSIVETGAGALWIEGGRINLAYWDQKSEGGRTGLSQGSDGLIYEKGCGGGGNNNRSGRWPANLLLAHIAPSTCPTCNGDGCEACDGEGLVGGCRRVGEKRVRPTGGRGETKRDCKSFLGSWDNTDTTTGPVDPDGLETVADWQCVDGCAVRALGEQSGIRTTSAWTGKRNSPKMSSVYKYFEGHQEQPREASRGTAARFFHQSDWTAERIEHAAPVFYCAKSSRRERDSGLENFDEQPVRRLSGGEFAHNSITRKVSKNETVTRNFHPTCKPIALAKHLATLLLPPPEYAPRRLLIPFAGSGSEAIGALLAGWEEIVCIELIQDYCAIAETRLAWWADWLAYTGVDDPKELLRLSNNDKVRKEKEAARLV